MDLDSSDGDEAQMEHPTANSGGSIISQGPNINQKADRGPKAALSQEFRSRQLYSDVLMISSIFPAPKRLQKTLVCLPLLLVNRVLSELGLPSYANMNQV